MRDFDLIAFDLDGTVFASPRKQRVTPRVERAFAAAHDAGVTIAVGSGRPFWMLGPQLPSASWLDWAVTASGARVTPLRGADAGRGCPIERQRALELLALVRVHGGHMTLHTNRDTYVERARLAAFDMVKDALRSRDITQEALDELMDPAARATANPIDELVRSNAMTPVDSAADFLARSPELDLDKLDFNMPDVATADELARAMDELGGLEVARLGERDFEVTAAGATKGDAVGWLCRHLGIPEERAVAFGDSANDLTLTGRALTFVAMGNATAEVKAVADDQCDTVFADGVAKWIEERL